jgi:autotransporter-associated beta strand protein
MKPESFHPQPALPAEALPVVIHSKSEPRIHMNKLAASIVSACFRSLLLVLLVLGTHITRADYASTLDALTGTVPADNWQLNVSSVTGTTPNLGSKGGTATFNSGNTAVSGPQPDLYTGFPAGNNAVAVGSTAGGLSCGTGAAIPGTGNFSVVAWIKTTASGASRDYEIVSQRDSSGSGYNGTIRIYMDSVGRIHFWVYESGFQWTSGSDGSSISTPLSYNDGKWHQIVCVRSGATGSIYLDGASVASNTGTAAKNLAALGVYIGYNQRDNWGFFNGSIAQTAIYSSALTAGNVTSLYTAAGYTPPLSVVKAATGTDLTAGASWTGGSAPTTSISGTWTGSSLGAGLTVGSDVSWAAISVASAASDIAITGAGTLTLGAAGIDMSASSVNLSIANSTALGASQSWVVNTGKSLSDSGVISGSSYSLDKSGAGTLTLSGNSTYSGGTTLNAGQLNINNGGSSSANSAIGTGTLTLAGGTIDNTSAGDVTLSPTIAQSWNGDFTYAGSVHNLNLGTGTVTLGASRQVTVTANTLTLGGSISGTGLNLTKAGVGTLGLAGGATLATLQPDVGTLAISAGDINVATQIGNSDWGTARTSTVNQTDGTVTLASNAKYYGSRSGNQAITYNLSGGTFDASIGRFNIAWDGGSNNPTFTVSGGLLKVYGLDGASSIGGAASAGTLALTGGQITIGANGIGNANYNASNYANVLNFGGGTIAASTGFSGGALQAITLTGTGGNTTFDTTGGNISLAGVLNGAGGLNKAGSGTLTLSNTNTYAGTTTLNAGSLTLSGSGTLGGSGSALTVTGGTLDLGALSRTNGAVLISGAGTIQNGTLTGSSYSATLTSGTATVSAVLAGSSVDLTMNGAGGTLTLNNANTYSGNTSINAGTLALGASGALNAASNVSIAAGGTFDVSAFTTYTLGASASLSASGNATAATLKGDTEVNLGSRPIALTWSGASSGTDSAHPALTVSQGTLALSNNTFTVVVPGSALDVGVYTLVSAPSITGSVNFAPSFTGGNGLVVGDVGIVSISGNNVILTVSMPSATLVASGSPISSLSTSYGTPSSEKSFTVAGTTLTAGVTVTPPAGYEVSTTSGSGYTGSGTAITFGSAPTVATTTVYVRLAANAPVSGTYDSQSLVLSSPQAVDIYVATASSGNSVAAKALTLDSATAQDKAYDGTTAGTVTGAFQTAQAFGSGTSSDGIPYTGDILTASAPGTFASSEIGTGISVTADTFTLGGSSAGNYTLTQPTGLSLSASIISTATWSNLAGGSWPTVGNWLNGVGNGADITADFSTLTLAANPTVTLDGARTIGNLTFGDVGNTHAWTVNTGSGGPLTLATSSGSSVITVSNQSTTIAAVLAGTNGLIKTGAGRLTLSVANSYTGATTISQGTIIDSSSNALGTAATVVINDANTAANDTSLLLGSLTLSKAVTVANQGSGTTTLGANGSVANPEFSGAITLAKDVILNGGTNTDRLTFTGGISGTGNVTIASTGRVMFLNAANTFNGNLTINDGSILQLHWGDPSSISYIPDASILTVNGTLKFAKKNSSETIGGLSGNGTLQGHEGVTNSATGLVINATGDNTFSGVLSDGGATGSKLSLTKSGAGSQTLSGTNSYSGTTTINGGTLSLGSAGSIATSSSISVASGAVLDALTSGLALDNGKTLRGSGSVIGNVACGTTGVTVLAPGNGTDGSLTITGNLTLAGAADINIGLLASYSAAAALAVTGDLDATTAGTGNVVINLPTTSVDAGIY